MTRDQDPGKGRFGQRRPLDQSGDIDGCGYEAIVLERLAKHACRIAGRCTQGCTDRLQQ